MKKPMSRLLASVLAAIMLINCMIVTALAADARVISMNYQPHPLYPGMNGNAVVEVDYGDSTGRGICVEPAKDGPAVGSTLSLSEADTTMTRYAYMASQTSDIYRTWCIHHAAPHAHLLLYWWEADHFAGVGEELLHNHVCIGVKGGRFNSQQFAILHF